MLGDSSLRQWYASADSLSVKPNVTCEWNANDFAILRSFGHGDGIPTSVTNTTITYTYTDPSTGVIQDLTKTTITSLTGLSGVGNSYRLSMSIQASSQIDLTFTAVAKNSTGQIINLSLIHI